MIFKLISENAHACICAQVCDMPCAIQVSSSLPAWLYLCEALCRAQQAERGHWGSGRRKIWKIPSAMAGGWAVISILLNSSWLYQTQESCAQQMLRALVLQDGWKDGLGCDPKAHTALPGALTRRINTTALHLLQQKRANPFSSKGSSGGCRHNWP